MKIKFTWSGSVYVADLSLPLEIGIPLISGVKNQPNAYDAPPYIASPVVAGNFIGSLEAGSPVNFYNLALNPHGNGTHTECVGHILDGNYSIRQSLEQSHFVAEVISVLPEKNAKGESITLAALKDSVRHTSDALVIRTLPNTKDKLTRKYTNANPPWIDPEAMRWIVHTGYRHLLIDLPSVDPESDAGALVAHKIFWAVDSVVREKCTITEMIYVPANVPDGLYLLDLHTAALELDVSPSRPMLFVMQMEE